MAEQAMTDSNGGILQVFEQFAQMYGVEAFREPRRVLGYVADMEPKMIDYVHCISKIYELNIPQQIESGVIADSNTAEKAIKALDDDDSSSEIALSIIEAFGEIYGRKISLRADYSTGIQIPYQVKKGEGLAVAMDKLDHIRWFLNNHNHYKWNNGNDSLDILRAMMNSPEQHKDEIRNKYKAIVHEFQNDPYKASIKIEDEVKTNGFSSSSFSDYFIVIGEEPVSMEFACYHGGPEVDQSIKSWQIKEKNFKTKIGEYRKKVANVTMPDVSRARYVLEESRNFILTSVGIVAVIIFLFGKLPQKLNLAESFRIAKENSINVFHILCKYHSYQNLTEYLVLIIAVVLCAVAFIVLLISCIRTIISGVKSRKYANAYKLLSNDLRVFDNEIDSYVSDINNIITNYYKGASNRTRLKYRDFSTLIKSISETKYGTSADVLKLKSVPEIGKKCRIIIVICAIVVFILSKTQVYTKAALGSQQLNQIMVNMVQRENSYISPIALEYNGHYYDVYSDASSWNEAKEKCESMGGHLVTLTTQEEDERVYNFLTESGYKSAFLGLKMKKTKKGKEKWYWIVGKKKKVSYAHWTEGEPDTGDDGNCIYGAYGERDESAWRALSASYLTTYICEWDSIEKAKKEQKQN